MVGKLGLIISFLLLFQAGNSTKTILFYGDSLTAGLGLTTEEAFPALVEKKFKQQGKPCKVINAGLSGETSAGGLSRNLRIFPPKPGPAEPGVGANAGRCRCPPPGDN